MRIANMKRYLSLPYVLLIPLAFLLLFVPFPDSAVSPVERTFRIDASRFAYTPSVLKANPGDRVTIELVSQDVVHGLVIDGYDLDVSADPGETTRLTFIADQSGSFRFRCSVTCGSMHPFMIGKLQVGTNNLLTRGIGLAVLSVMIVVWRGRL